MILKMPESCNICFKVFSNQSSVRRHVKNIHKQEEKNIVSYDFDCFNSKCLEDGCRTSYRFTDHLRSHLERIHNKIIEKEILSFQTIEDFECWLSALYRTNNVAYVRDKRTKEGITYFNCNRSGKCNTKIERERAIKFQGSCKIGSWCTSQIILTHDMTENKQYVTFYKSHYGHTIEIKHIRIPKQTRIDVATKLTSGISANRILDTYHNNFLEDQLLKSDLITRKEINNIKTAFHITIQDGVRHKNDSVSVDLLVKECGEVGNWVLLYEKQGQEYPRLKADDFCVIFMNTVQENMLKEFGNLVIAIDSTHGLNMYDFELTTLMVIDEFGEGFPAACMFLNRKDTVIHDIFFECIKMRCGVICPKVFMSDITSVYYNAWLNIMGDGVLHQLYCSWHIDRAWRSNLNKIIRSDRRKQVYQMLKVLQTTLITADFEKNLRSTVKMLLSDTETKNFGTYFMENYTNNYKKWAYCYRKNCGINTNMVKA